MNFDEDFVNYYEDRSFSRYGLLTEHLTDEQLALLDEYITAVDSMDESELDKYSNRVYGVDFKELRDLDRETIQALIFSTTHEIWKPVYYMGTLTNYTVSSFGTIKNGAGIPLVPYVSNKGYHSIKISISGWKRGMLVHQVVARAFIPNPFSKPEVNHIDGNKSNNNVSNLEWLTHAENMQHAYESGLINNQGTNHPGNKYSEDQIKEVIELLKDPRLTFQEIEKITGVSYGVAHAIYSKKLWTNLTEGIEFKKHSKANRNPLANEDHPMAKYTRDQIKQTCDLLMDPDKSFKNIARVTGVSEGMVGRIYRKESWLGVAKDYDFPWRPPNCKYYTIGER